MIKLRSLIAHDFKQLQNIRLRFPDRGSVLIEGRNEAGKSTLFEAVFFALFGKGLNSQQGDLLAYGSTLGFVELEVDVADRRITVRRDLKPRGIQARLNIIDAEGKLEDSATGIRAVNERLSRELRLDGDALLNSCFVEQKKLGKLEETDSSRREASLMRLLNLDEMQEQENHLKVSRSEEMDLARQEMRCRLAGLVASLPEIKAKEQDLLSRLDVIVVKHSLAEMDRFRLEEQKAIAELETLRADHDKVQARLARLNELSESASVVRAALASLRNLETSDQQIRDLRAELAEVGRLETEELPNLRQNRRRTEILLHALDRLQRLEQIRIERDKRVRQYEEERRILAEQKQRISILTATETEIAGEVATLEQRASEARSRAQAVETRTALEDWLSARKATQMGSDLNRQRIPLDQAESEAQNARQAAEAAVASASARVRTHGAILIVFTLLSIAYLVAALISTALPLPAVALPLVAAAFFLLKRVTGGRELRLAVKARESANETYLRARESLVRLDAQLETAQAAQGPAGIRLSNAEASLERLGEVIPRTIEEAERRITALPDTDDASAEELRDTERRIAGQLGDARARLTSCRAELQSVLASVEGRSEAILSADIEAGARFTARLDCVLDYGRDLARKRADSLGIEPSRDEAGRLMGAIDANIRGALDRVNGIAALNKRIDDISAGQINERRHIEEHASRLTEVVGRDLELTDAEMAEAVRRELQEEYQSIASTNPQAENTRLTNLIQRREADRQVAATERQRMEAQARGAADALGYPGDAVLDPVALCTAIPAWDDVNIADTESLRRESESTHDRRVQIEHEQARLENELGIGGALLDLQAEDETFAQAVRDIKIRRRATQILATARRNIVAKVMPFTMQHMRRILPALTMDRYHDAQLQQDNTLLVWDERAGAMKSKNLFSGGAKDQFSLSLRLAFAMATLPTERGTQPGFLFLDEPLSSFDSERAEALLYLLTQGDIANAFDQIFVVSHTKTMAAEGFHYHIVMDQGRISEGTSPELILPSDDDAFQLDLLAAAQPTAEEPIEDAD